MSIIDDKCTEKYVDTQLGFRSHKTHTPSYQLKLSRIEQRIVKFHEDLYARSVNENSWFRYFISCYKLFWNIWAICVYDSILNFRYEACNRFNNERGFGAKIVANIYIKK